MLKVSSSVWASADKGTVPTFSFPDDTYFLHYLRFHNLIVCLAAKNQDLLFYSRKGELVGECSALAVSPVRYLLEISRDYLVLGKNVRPVTLTVIDMKAVLAGKKQSNTMVSFHAVTEHRQTLRAVHLLRDGSFVVISDNNVFATRWKLTHGPTVKLEQIEVYRLPAGCGKSGLYSVASSEDYLLAGDDAGGVGIWNLRTAHSRYVKTESNMQILTVLVMDASRAVFAPNENYLLVYNYVTGDYLCKLTGHTSLVSNGALARATGAGSFDYSARCWNIDTQTCLWSAEADRTVNRVYVSGAYAIVDSWSRLCVYCVDDGRLIANMLFPFGVSSVIVDEGMVISKNTVHILADLHTKE